MNQAISGIRIHPAINRGIRLSKRTRFTGFIGKNTVLQTASRSCSCTAGRVRDATRFSPTFSIRSDTGSFFSTSAAVARAHLAQATTTLNRTARTHPAGKFGQAAGGARGAPKPRAQSPRCHRLNPPDHGLTRRPMRARNSTRSSWCWRVSRWNSLHMAPRLLDRLHLSQQPNPKIRFALDSPLEGSGNQVRSRLPAGGRWI